MKTVRRHCWTNSPPAQIARVKDGQTKFSHDELLPLVLAVKRNGWFTRRVIATTTEEVSYHDAIISVIVPKGFTCDLGSVPRPMWWFVSPWDIALESLFHDQLYREQKVERSVADFVLRHMMQLRGVPWWVRWPVYLSVRLFGGAAWKAHRRRTHGSIGNV